MTRILIAACCVAFVASVSAASAQLKNPAPPTAMARSAGFGANTKTMSKIPKRMIKTVAANQI